MGVKLDKCQMEIKLETMKPLPPSASAVFWMLTALQESSHSYGITELAGMSYMHNSTFFRGLATLKELGMAEDDGNSVRLKLVLDDEKPKRARRRDDK
jgi:hypothetical protein